MSVFYFQRLIKVIIHYKNLNIKGKHNILLIIEQKFSQRLHIKVVIHYNKKDASHSRFIKLHKSIPLHKKGCITH